MPEDRDTRTRKMPPAEVAKQLAKAESFETHTGVTPVHGVPTVDPEGPVQTLVRRSAQTKNMVIDVQAEVSALGGRVTTLEAKVASVASAVDAQGQQNERIIGLTSDALSILKSREMVTTTTQLAQVEVTTKRALTDNELTLKSGLVAIDDDKLRRAARREHMRKVFDRFVLPILAAFATYVAIKLGA